MGRSFLLIIGISLLSGCAAFPTQPIKMNAAVLTDGLKVVRQNNPGDELIKQLALSAEVNEQVLGAPKERIDINDTVAIAENRDTAQSQIKASGNTVAWIFGIGGMAAGMLGQAGVKKFLEKLAEKRATAKTS